MARAALSEGPAPGPFVLSLFPRTLHRHCNSGTTDRHYQMWSQATAKGRLGRERGAPPRAFPQATAVVPPLSPPPASASRPGEARPAGGPAFREPAGGALAAPRVSSTLLLEQPRLDVVEVQAEPRPLAAGDDPIALVAQHVAAVAWILGRSAAGLLEDEPPSARGPSGPVLSRSLVAVFVLRHGVSSPAGARARGGGGEGTRRRFSCLRPAPDRRALPRRGRAARAQGRSLWRVGAPRGE